MIDTHAHLTYLKDPLSEIISRARQAGLCHIVTVAVDLEMAKESAKISQDNPGFVSATIGLHPCETRQSAQLDRFESLLNAYPFVAIGEAGIDLYRDNGPLNDQKAVFRFQLEMARQHDLPIIIHNRNADEPVLDVVRDFPDVRKVVHCYSSDWQYAQELMRYNTIFSFTGMITYAKKGKAIDAVRNIPLNAMMIETDCPFLTPEAYCGKPNEPSFVGEVAKKIALIKGISLQEVVDTTTQRAVDFFSLSL